VRFAALVGLLLAGALGCVRSYATAPALPYAEIRYESPQGKPWPEKSVVLPEIRAQHRLLVDPRVSYVELNPGGARTIVFLHGLGSYLKFWRYQLDELAARGDRVLALDMLGYGKSDKPASFSYTTEAMADVVRAFVRRVGAHKPVLVGHSMGGQISLSYAIRFPDELSGLVLTSPAGFEEFGDREKRWFEKVFSVSLVAGASEYDIWGSIRYNNFHRWKPEYEWLIEERVRTAKNEAFKSYAYANVKSVRGLAANDFVRDNLAKVTVPTLIVHGDQDRLIPNPFMHGGSTREVMEYGHRRIRGSKLVTLEDCGHTVQMDCAVEYNRAVAGFLATVPPPPAPAPAAPAPTPAAPAPTPAAPAAAPIKADPAAAAEAEGTQTTP
jgi:pimeloyl-ACP methyl ester carboxylesterase